MSNEQLGTGSAEYWAARDVAEKTGRTVCDVMEEAKLRKDIPQLQPAEAKRVEKLKADAAKIQHELEQAEARAQAAIREWNLTLDEYQALQKQLVEGRAMQSGLVDELPGRLAYIDACLEGKAPQPHHNSLGIVVQLFGMVSGIERTLTYLPGWIERTEQKLAAAGERLKAMAKEHKITDKLPAHLRQ